MAVSVKGFNFLATCNYKSMIIKESSDGYVVDVKGKTMGMSGIRNNKDGNDLERIKYLVKIFLNNTTLNQIGLSTLSFHKGLYFVANGSKKIALQICNSELDTVRKMIVDAYSEDRDVFCNSNNAAVYNISLGTTFSSYEKINLNCEKCKGCDDVIDCEESMKFELFSDSKSLLEFESEFVSKFVYERLFSIGTKAEIMTDKEYLGIDNQENCKDYYICCGDIVITFSNQEPLMFLFDLVDTYNKNRNSMNVRKLKMEGLKNE